MKQYYIFNPNLSLENLTTYNLQTKSVYNTKTDTESLEMYM